RLASEIKDPEFQDWAKEFCALDRGALAQGLELLGRLNLNLNKHRKNPAAKQFKQEIVPRLTAQWIGEYYGEHRSLLRLALERIDATYRARKRAKSIVDFADLEEETVRLLESDSSVKRDIAGRFDEVLMDELQDTNPLQWRLVNLVR